MPRATTAAIDKPEDGVRLDPAPRLAHRAAQHSGLRPTEDGAHVRARRPHRPRPQCWRRGSGYARRRAGLRRTAGAVIPTASTAAHDRSTPHLWTGSPRGTSVADQPKLPCSWPLRLPSGRLVTLAARRSTEQDRWTPHPPGFSALGGRCRRGSRLRACRGAPVRASQSSSLGPRRHRPRLEADVASGRTAAWRGRGTSSTISVRIDASSRRTTVQHVRPAQHVDAAVSLVAHRRSLSPERGSASSTRPTVSSASTVPPDHEHFLLLWLPTGPAYEYPGRPSTPG